MPLEIILLEMFPLSIIQLKVELAKNVSDGYRNQTVLALSQTKGCFGGLGRLDPSSLAKWVDLES